MVGSGLRLGVGFVNPCQSWLGSWVGVFGHGLWCCLSFAGCLWCSLLGLGLGLLMGRVWFRYACLPPFPVPVCGVGVRGGPGSRLCPALLGWVVGVCFLRFFFWLCGVGCWVSLSLALWSVPLSPLFRAGLLAFFFSWCVSACFGAPFPGWALFLAWCCRFWLGGPPMPLWRRPEQPLRRLKKCFSRGEVDGKTGICLTAHPPGSRPPRDTHGGVSVTRETVEPPCPRETAATCAPPSRAQSPLDRSERASLHALHS